MTNVFLPPNICVPQSYVITAITQSNPMQITISSTSEYIVGQLVRLFVPSSYQMFQANNLTGQILSLTATTMNVNIDSSLFDAFVVPATYTPQPASLAPAGARNIYDTATVPFHSLNNIGN